jgi:hypothetical protein
MQDALSSFGALGSKIYAIETEVRLLEADLLAGEFGGVAERARDLSSRVKALGGGDVLEATVLRQLALAEVAEDVEAALKTLDESIAEVHRISADYELANCLAARAVVRASQLEPEAATRETAVADAVEARRLFGELGVISTPVTSLDDLWPTGPLARRLAGV